MFGVSRFNFPKKSIQEVPSSAQKQPSGVFYIKSYSEKFLNIHRITFVGVRFLIKF